MAEDTTPIAPAVEATAHATNTEQEGYQQDVYQQGEYQQGDYQQGDYQEGDYSQADYQQGEYAQDGYQQGDYQQGDYQQADYQQGEYAQDGYQQADYQQGDYQQGDYQQADYQQGEYAQDGYDPAAYQQGDYEQPEYAQEGYQQEEQQTGTEVEQTSTEPGVLPVSSEYQDQAEFNASGVYQGHPNGAEYSTEGEQPQKDYASNNNAWWGNGEGAYSDPNSTEQQPLPADGQAPVEDASQSNYEEGQFISFGAVPTIPSFGQPAVPVNNTSNTQQHAFDDADDLGMGNNSLKKEKPAVAAEDANSQNAAGEAGQDANAAMGDGSDESKAGWWPKIALFGGEKRETTPKPVKANLGEESSFYFDKEQQRWVNKKGGSESSSAAEALPPPPMSRTPAPAAAAGSGPAPVAGGPPAMNRGPPSSGGPIPPAGGPPGPRPGAGSAARRGARAKYVDVLNPQ